MRSCWTCEPATRSLVARARDDGRPRGQGRRRPALGARRRRPRNLLRGLVALWLSYLACALTFLFIGQVWANHHVMFDHFRTAGRDVLMTRRPSRNHHLRICRCAQRSARLAGRRPGFASTVHGRGAHALIPDLDDALA